MNGAERQTLRLVPTNSHAAEYITLPKDGSQRVEPGIGVGGPVMQDKLWFFASYLPSLEKFERSAQFSNGTPVTREQTDNTHYFSANATSQLTNSTRGKIAYNSAKRTIKGVLPGRALPGENGTTTPLGAARHQRHPAELVAVGQLRLRRQRQVLHRRPRRLLQAGPVQRGHPGGDAVPLPDDQRRPGRRARAVPAQQRLHEHPDQPQRHPQHLRPRQLPGGRHLLRATSPARTRSRAACSSTASPTTCSTPSRAT